MAQQFQQQAPQQFQQQAPQQSSGVSPVVTVVVAIVVLTLLGVVIWQLAIRTPATALVQQPPPPPQETEEQKKARLDKEAADKAAALTAETTAKEQALLDADVKASVDRLVNIPYEVNQTRTLFGTYRFAIADPVNKASVTPIPKSTETDPTKIALESVKNADLISKNILAKANQAKLALPFQTQRERALNSAGWGNYLAQNIENRAKVLNKTTDATVAKAITDLRAASAAAFTALNSADTGADTLRDSKGCVQHMTGNGVAVVCPAQFNTFYTFGVNAAADCRTVDGLCNRCVGYDFPKPVGGRSGTQWNNNKWQAPAGQSTGPVKEGEGSVMSFSGIYVVDGVAADSQQCS